MNHSGRLPVSESAFRVTKTKAQRGRPRKKISNQNGSVTPDLPAVGTLSRTKALLLAALRVWELKQRVGQ
jgi:hypothetical protein